LRTHELELSQPARSSRLDFGVTPSGICARLRAVEWVRGAFFTYSSILTIVLLLSPQVRARTLATNAVVLCTTVLLVKWPQRGWTEITRDWYALALVLLAYKQIGWFAPPNHDHRLERLWMPWDYLVLRDLGVKVEILGPIGPALLELSYLLVYATGPLCLAMFYWFGRRERAGAFLTIYVLGLFLSYGQFPFWPSEPPRIVFQETLEPAANVVRDANLFVVGHAGIQTSVFPSAHVSGAFPAAFALRTLLGGRVWLGRALMFYAVVVAIATIYGRYHFIVDVIAGVHVAIVELWVSQSLLAARSHLRISNRWPYKLLHQERN
jgi:membrane-associated phospholipid phosphatase